MKLPWNRPSKSSAAETRRQFSEEALPHLDAVYRFSLRLVRGRTEEADDLVQDTFLQAFRSWHTYTTGTNCRAWLFTICRNRFLRKQERRNRRPELNEADIEADVEAMAATAVFSEVDVANPEHDFFNSFLDEEVVAAIDELPASYREVLVLCDLEGTSYPELSEILDIPIGTVKSRLFRGRRMLQQSLYRYALEMGYITPKERE